MSLAEPTVTAATGAVLGVGSTTASRWGATSADWATVHAVTG